MPENDFCPECKGKVLEDNKEIWCYNCGLVLAEKIDLTKEKSYEGNDENFFPLLFNIPSIPLEPTKIG